MRTYNYWRDNYPINFVSWFDEKTYFEWKNKRLPREAEWEKSARGGLGRKHAWGTTPQRNCELTIRHNSEGPGCGTNLPWEIGSSPLEASVYGLHNTAGNLSEWVADWYIPDYYQTQVNAGWPPNPTGPVSGYCRVRRGGNFIEVGDSQYRASCRGYQHPDLLRANTAFRCAQDVLNE